MNNDCRRHGRDDHASFSLVGRFFGEILLVIETNLVILCFRTKNQVIEA